MPKYNIRYSETLEHHASVVADSEAEAIENLKNNEFDYISEGECNRGVERKVISIDKESEDG